MSAVPIKIFYTNSQHATEVRRFDMAVNERITLDNLKARLAQLFPQLATTSYNLYWEDRDKDQVVVKTEEELQIALAEMADSLPHRFFVHMQDQVTDESKVTGGKGLDQSTYQANKQSSEEIRRRRRPRWADEGQSMRTRNSCKAEDKRCLQAAG
jgi:hypothetical protein